jgi:hypothetical protein
VAELPLPCYLKIMRVDMMEAGIFLYVSHKNYPVRSVFIHEGSFDDDF